MYRSVHVDYLVFYMYLFMSSWTILFLSIFSEGVLCGGKMQKNWKFFWCEWQINNGTHRFQFSV